MEYAHPNTALRHRGDLMIYKHTFAFKFENTIRICNNVMLFMNRLFTSNDVLKRNSEFYDNFKDISRRNVSKQAVFSNTRRYKPCSLFMLRYHIT